MSRREGHPNSHCIHMRCGGGGGGEEPHCLHNVRPAVFTDTDHDMHQQPLRQWTSVFRLSVLPVTANPRLIKLGTT